MAGHDRPPVAMRLENPVAQQDRGPGSAVVLQVEHDEIHPPAGEKLEMVVVVGPVMAAVVRAVR